MAHMTLSFGGGCFWGVEHAFKQLEGVLNTEVGYQGGTTENPSYPEVCSKTTGHCEVVKISFDSEVISLERILDAFFFMHDPSQLNRQGPDVGSQYRSAIFPSDDIQAKKVEEYLINFKDNFNGEVVTTIETNQIFYPAEENHQDYLMLNPGGYCHIGFDVFQKLKMGQF